MSPYAERLAQAIGVRRREGMSPTRDITDAQIALVMRALADHTLIQSGLKFAPDDGPWPQATSLGRFFHHLADEFGDRALSQDGHATWWERVEQSLGEFQERQGDT